MIKLNMHITRSEVQLFLQIMYYKTKPNVGLHNTYIPYPEVSVVVGFAGYFNKTEFKPFNQKEGKDTLFQGAHFIVIKQNLQGYPQNMRR